MSGNRIFAGIFVLAVVAVCIAIVPLAAQLGLLFLYIEPNPRHLPPVLMGEAVGWAVIGLLTGAFTVTLAESLVWQYRDTVWTQYRGLILGSVVALIVGVALGIAFAIPQMHSVDGQAMTSRQLAILAGGTAAGIATVAGIIAGTTLRRFVVGLYRLPEKDRSSRLTFNDEDATGAHRRVVERSSHAGKHP